MQEQNNREIPLQQHNPSITAKLKQHFKRKSRRIKVVVAHTQSNTLIMLSLHYSAPDVEAAGASLCSGESAVLSLHEAAPDWKHEARTD